ncbi:hypothetical protein CH330_04450 [candidate division WOR-3 bacterium JGI_Cruoil_03_51_56]|uniref:Secretion system C-terminal sorting domain-containing protein n=1 Tax=candidate division WOR-3 bacterium JGI_Cruoil_03_51_56 TaxID=1973747 RepID=A0A235BUE6_UNCW3|nr:MAG: hypothetical protein CH330_04450 [candidate division WOR-3 bacterium JGI_Cruoil_03_51_56]
MSKAALLLALLIAVGLAQQVVWSRCLTGIGPYDYLDLAVDTRDNVIVTTVPWVRKYSPDGDSLWAKELHLPASPPYDVATTQVATDPEDNIIVGKTTSDTTWVVMKLTPTGESLWTWDTVLPTPGYYWLTDIATNSNSCILVTGCYPSTYDGRWVTFQLTPDGRTDWMRTFTSNWGPEFAEGVCADPFDNVVVGGSRGISGRPRQWFPQLIKYSQDGDTLAEVVYDPYPFPANLDGYEPATDPEGNMLLPGGGVIWDTTGGRYRWHGAFLFKYDPQGNPLWQWFSDTTRNGLFEFQGCGTDTAGNIFAAGSRVLPDSRLVIELRRFTPEGDTVWKFYCPMCENANRYHPPPVSLAIDRQGDIITVATTTCVAPHPDTAYIFKVSERPGIAEAQERCKVKSFWLPTIIGSAHAMRLTFPSDTRAEVYDESGRLVQKLGSDRTVRVPSAGVYFIRLESPSYQQTGKLVVTK